MVHLARQLLKISVFFIIYLAFSGCDEKIFKSNVDCDQCYSQRPDSIDLIIDLTINEQYPEVPVLIFKGNVDNGEFIDTFFINSSPAYIWLKAGKTYSAKAVYSSNGNTIYAIDGSEEKIKKVNETCTETCWVVDGTELDLVLDY